jgi:hypothetical protein
MGVILEIGRILIEIEAPPKVCSVVIIHSLLNPLTSGPYLTRIDLGQSVTFPKSLLDVRGSPVISSDHRLLIVRELLLEVV